MIRIKGLNVDLGEFLLEDINISVDKNQFFILMGPTGSGKTVLLEAIAGLVPVKSGKILIGERDVTRLPPEKRGISIVYQDYALFPHLTVLDNINYGLHFHKVEMQEQKKRRKRLIQQLNLHHLLHRYPDTLSGGELQRVALARALIIHPEVLLLDEPLSALDPVFREETREALSGLHRLSNITFIMVTHDFAEALSLAQQAAVINNGRIQQTGTMKEIFRCPASKFVAEFVGMKNCIPVEFRGTSAASEGLTIETGRAWGKERGYIAVRPEDIVISRGPLNSSMRNSFQGKVAGVHDRGFFYEIVVMVGDTSFTSLITKSTLFDLGIQEGMSIWISFKSTAVHGF
jgi:molybdate/tungstate transport system ATP-binding protein